MSIADASVPAASQRARRADEAATPRRYRWLDPRDTAVWVFAACIVALIALGRAVGPDMHGGLPRTLLYVGAFGAAAWLFASVLFHWFDRASTRPRQSSAPYAAASDAADAADANARNLYAYWMTPTAPTTFGAIMRRDGWRWFVAAIVCWLPWFLISWPGVLRDDTIAQFMQSSGLHGYYSQHPLFDTLIFGLFWNAGEALGSLKLGMGLYIAAQMVAFAAGVAIVMCFLRKRGAARSVLAVVLLCFGFAPGIAGAVPTMAKDSIHAVFLLPIAVLFAEAVLTRGRVLARIPVCVAMTALIVLAALSKRTSTMAVIVAFIVLIIVAKGRRLASAACLVLAIVLAQGAIEPALERATQAQITPSKEVMAEVLQPIARVQTLHPERITPRERAALAGVADLDQAGRNYVDWRTDEVAWTVNPQATGGDKLRAIGAWVTIGLRNPGEYVKAYGSVTFGWYYPRVAAFYGWHSENTFNPQYMVQWNTFVTPPNTAEHELAPLRGTDRKASWRAKAGRLVERVANTPLNALAYYATYLPLALLCYGISRRRWGAVGAGVFLGAHVLVLYASPLAFVWYLLPEAFLLPLFLGVNALPER